MELLNFLIHIISRISLLIFDCVISFSIICMFICFRECPGRLKCFPVGVLTKPFLTYLMYSPNRSLIVRPVCPMYWAEQCWQEIQYMTEDDWQSNLWVLITYILVLDACTVGEGTCYKWEPCIWKGQ